MNKACLIIGCGSHAHSVISIVESSGEKYRILGLIDTSSNYDPSEEKSGYSVINNLENILINSSEYSHLSYFIAIGDNENRKSVFEKLKAHGFKLPNVSAPSAFIDRTVNLGEGNIIAHNVIINAQSTLGHNNLINTGTIIEHDCTIGDHNHFAPRSVTCGGVSFSDLVFVGAGSIVLPQLKVSSGVLLGAGSLLNFNASMPNSIVFGVPGKVRNI